MDKPRILIFSIAYEPLTGGAELAVRQLTDRLSQYEFDLITCRFKDTKAFERIGNVNVFRVGFGSKLGRYLYPALAFRLAAKQHKKTPYQAVWSIMAAYAGAAALMFLRRNRGVKFILTLQEGDSLEHIHRRVRGFRSSWQKIFKRADQIQTISNYLGNWAKHEGATCPIEVIPNGVELEKFVYKNSPQPPLYQRGGEGEFKIITVSRLVPKNGIDILIRAAAELKTLIPNSRFLIQILGSGSEEKKLQELAEDLKVENQINFLGDIDPEKVPEYLAQADIFVRPSRSEGLGSAFLEAMAAGLPVIATPVGGIPDFLKDQETGIFCKPHDPGDLALKIKRLWENPDLRNKLSKQGRDLVEKNYTWEIVAKKMDQQFSKLI